MAEDVETTRGLFLLFRFILKPRGLHSVDDGHCEVDVDAVEKDLSDVERNFIRLGQEPVHQDHRLAQQNACV